MSRSGVLLLAALVVAMVAVCPFVEASSAVGVAVPVMLTFKDSLNCSGTHTNSSNVLPAGTTLGECVSDTTTNTSTRSNCGSVSGMVVSIFDDTTCTNVISTTTVAVNTCFYNGQDVGSEVFLCRATDTYSEVPQTGRVSDPEYYGTGSRFMCQGNGTPDCNGQGDPVFCYNLYNSREDNGTCPVDALIGIQCYVQSAGFAMNQCFYTGIFNIQYTCTGDYLTYRYYQNPNGCTGTVIEEVSLATDCITFHGTQNKRRGDGILDFLGDSLLNIAGGNSKLMRDTTDSFSGIKFISSPCYQPPPPHAPVAAPLEPSEPSQDDSGNPPPSAPSPTGTASHKALSASAALVMAIALVANF